MFYKVLLAAILVSEFTRISCLLQHMDRSDVMAVKARLEDEKARRLLLQNDVEMLMLKTARLERQIGRDSESGVKGSSSKGCHADGTVAFQAKLTTTTTLVRNQVVVFDTVIANIGDAYNGGNGNFVAPVSGVYVFGLTILAVPGATVHCSIAVNGTDMVTINSMKGPGHDQASTTLLTHLNEGDTVLVRNRDYSGVNVHGGNYSQFYGFLLAADVDCGESGRSAA